MTSHIVIAAGDAGIRAARIGPASADALLGCDLLVAAGSDALAALRHGHSRAVLNEHETITGGFTRNPDDRLPLPGLAAAVREACGADRVDVIDATGLATRLLGDAIATNLFMLGYAWQKGLVPVGRAAIEEATRLNGAAVEMNLSAFGWGRRAAIDLAAAEQASKGQAHVGEAFAHRRRSESLDQAIARRVALLTAYQDAAYADRYRGLVDRVRSAESRAAPGSQKLTETVSRYFYKLMAYKDEYEVARLYTTGAFAAQLAEQFEPGYRLKFHLAPPAIATRDRTTGHPAKRAFGGWVLPAFRLLAQLKGLRGTRFDPFGYSKERCAERQLIAEYEATISGLLSALAWDNLALAVQIAALPERIRGYGHVKERNMRAAGQERERLLAAYGAPPQKAIAAE